MKKLLLILAVLGTAVNVSAYDFEVDGIYYNYLSQEDLTCQVTYQQYSGWSYSSSYSGNFIIPSSVTYNGSIFSVTSIGDYAFSRCSNLISVEIPSSVTSIGGKAFWMCGDLKSVTIPSSVTSIGDYAFYRCSSLTTFNGDLASEDHRCLILDGILKGFAPAGLTTYTVPNSVTSIGSYTFSHCGDLKTLTIGNSVTSIKSYAFECSGLTSMEFPNSLTSIGGYAFVECGNLTSIEIPNSVTFIGENAFSKCSSLTSVVIGNSVTEIRGSTFENCKNLVSVEIGNSVASISWGAFRGCSNLTTFTGELASDDHRCVIIQGNLAAFAPGGLTTYNIPNSVICIGEGVFDRCEQLTSLEIPSSVLYIGNYVFSGCTSLTSVIIPNTVANIGEGAFKYCQSLTSIELPSALTRIKSSAFKCCSSLISVVIPSSVTIIEREAFEGCDGLTSIVIPNSVTEIGQSAFSSCESLKEITSFAVTPPTIYSSTFKGVSKTDTEVKVPEMSLDSYKTAIYWQDFFNITCLDPSGIDAIFNDENGNRGKIYDLKGIEVNKDYKGIVIKEGKKILIR